jgi:hypothetical protein
MLQLENDTLNTHPAMIPKVCSSISVRPKVTISTLALRQSRSRRRNSSFSAMFQHTTTSTPASADNGMKLASGTATSMKASTKSACAMPETGLHAPARILVAVRAIVPVTLIPPNMAEATLAMPLRHDFHIVGMLTSGHAVGHLGGKQALNRPQQCEREGGRQHLKHR